MRYHKSFSIHSHAKDLPWNYAETLTKINQIPDNYWHRFLLASYSIGARQGEIIQLKNKDITISTMPDSTEPVMNIHLPTEKMRNKAFAYRDIPIRPNQSEVELSCFENWKSILKDKPEPEDTVFGRPEVLPKTNLRYVRRFSSKYLGRNHHFLRHCRLTHCVTQFNFNEYKLMQYAGWTHPEYAAWYVRLSSNDLRQAMRLQV